VYNKDGENIMPPLTSRVFADVWRTNYNTQTIDYNGQTITRQSLEEAIQEIRGMRNYGYNPLNDEKHNFDYGTTKHIRRKDDNKGI
jgi:hypothetical protein